MDPFHPHHNCVVGRNGSGKSNFFLAIQFVLSDEFSHMRPEQRQQLLHEGSGPKVVNAYVEIIFDNSDNRIPIEKEEVSIRRVIGFKKDQYFLDKKNVTKTDVMNLLESAGFSRSNPYYIVKQGKINQMAVAPDSQRLKLLREVAGTRVYDERKEESLTILKETEGKIEKINEFLQYIEERLKTLEEEKEELKEYQKWDRMHRSLEYTMYDKELREVRDKLESLDQQRLDEGDRTKDLHAALSSTNSEIKVLERELKELDIKGASKRTERDQLSDDRQYQIKQRTKLELDMKDLKDIVDDDSSVKGTSLEELEHVEEQIKKAQSTLDEVIPQYQEQKDIEEKCTSQLRVDEQRRTELYAKQGRNTQFTDQRKRDDWIKAELSSYVTQVDEKEQQLMAVQNEVQAHQDKIQKLSGDIKERTDNLEDRKKEIEDTNKELGQSKIKRDEVQNSRKELWRQDSNFEQSLTTSKEELDEAERQLRSTVSKAFNNGIDAIKKIVQEKNIQGVYGPLIENFKCNEKFFTAVEVTAGNRLFYIIVDTDKTASQILSIMNKNKMNGEVNFLPLNRLSYKEVQYPTSNDVISMVSKLEYNPIFKAAMETIFGKTLICRSLEIASQYARGEHMDCITLDGDQVSRRGALTGGYYDKRKSRLDSQRQVWYWQSKLQEEESNAGKIKGDMEKIDSELTKLVSTVQKLETRQVQLRETYERQKMDVQNLAQEKNQISKYLDTKERLLLSLEGDLTALRGTVASLQQELGTELLSQLDSNDQNEVQRLNKEINELQGKIRDSLEKRSKLEVEKNMYENLLTSNLYKRRSELLQSIDELGMSERKQDYDSKKAEFDQSTAAMESTKKRFDWLEGEMEVYNKKCRELAQQIEQGRTKEKEIQEAIEEESKSMEKMANKRSVKLRKKEEVMRKIRELGSLPADAFEKYQNMSQKELWKLLTKCNTELKKYAHVNKKALDQFVNFSEQKEKLIERKRELDKGYDAIKNMMDVLEHRKHEAIQLTFKQVSHFFTEIFKKLAPGGTATLVMKRSEFDEQGSSVPLVEQFTGVGIKVSFSGKVNETKEMQQLSGGQKSLVALTLIFAIQKCDPAPFYLFDEIDQALDPQHRKSVAELISKQSDSCQFITTTFRPELVQAANKHYGVVYRNKVSHVQQVNMEEALDFIEDEAADK